MDIKYNKLSKSNTSGWTGIRRTKHGNYEVRWMSQYRQKSKTFKGRHLFWAIVYRRSRVTKYYNRKT